MCHRSAWRHRLPLLSHALVALGVAAAEGPPSGPLEIVGVTVTPHARASSLRYRREPSPDRGARVQLFVRYPAKGDSPALTLRQVSFDGASPSQLVAEGVWAWHDTPEAWPPAERDVPPGALMVWAFNTASWKTGQVALPRLAPGIALAKPSRANQIPVSLEPSPVRLSALTFLSQSNAVRPDLLVLHIANGSDQAVRWEGCRLYLPESVATWRFCFREHDYEFQPQRRRRARTGGALATFPDDGLVPPGDKGCARIVTGPLPLTYGIIEVLLQDAQGRNFSLWAHQRIKREVFDLSGGWVGETRSNRNPLTQEAFLRTLRGLHVNTAHLGLVPGYTDQTGPSGLYTRYPLKFFGAGDLAVFDTDEMLPRVHAVEFLGEPQYRGGRGYKTPQEVYAALAPYSQGRLPTSLTLSDESHWRLYAGLSDYPHFDAYRVSAPRADAWRRYDRWGEQRIGWGAPLETIGDLCRALREQSQPAPIACWSQGPHHDGEVHDGRLRTSPTPEELRLQAYHALSSRITSLYWFNLSLPALVKFRDTLSELRRVGREIRLLEQFYLTGDAYRYGQLRRGDQLDWDLASVASPDGAVLFALDLDYFPDPTNKVFTFKPPREARFAFDLPAYLRPPADVFRVDADGVNDVAYQLTEHGLEISDRQNLVAIYVAAPSPNLRVALDRKRQALVADERALDFDPARSDADFAALRQLLNDP
jgi:hypothetical protein